MEKENQWISRLKHRQITRKCGRLYANAWKKHNKAARLPLTLKYRKQEKQ
jgi:hypothetical protein